MKSFYYTKTQKLIDQLGQIDELRKQLLLTPLSPRQELEVKWTGIIDQIYYTLMVNGTVIPKEKIAELITPQGKKILAPQEKAVVSCKMSLDYFYHEWLVSDESITVDTLSTILSFFDIQRIRLPENELTQILNYTQLNTEHPVVQAGLAYIFFYDLYQTSQELKVFTNLFYLMLLYKQGYDFRGMTVLERQLINDSMNYQVTVTNAIQQQNVTSWLEYFSVVVVSELRDRIGYIMTVKKQNNPVSKSFELNDRQKNILNLLNNPNVRVTNQQVQKYFKVSQITASRDLARLTALGLLLALGKGRSTKYAKF